MCLDEISDCLQYNRLFHRRLTEMSIQVLPGYIVYIHDMIFLVHIILGQSIPWHIRCIGNVDILIRSFMFLVNNI